ncbi:MAG: hypothetical protein KTR25_13015 [Myxococcales bacterium]|nr:hypothetical protein [Myxococcales bacterium]
MIFITSVTALLASSPDEQSVDVFSSFPGPSLLLSDQRPTRTYVLSVETVPESLPADRQWTEFVEVEMDFRTVETGIGPQSVMGEISQIVLSGDRVLPSTVAVARLPESRTFLLVDEQGRMNCVDARCSRIYVLRFELTGGGQVRAQWLIRAGINWDNEMSRPPESAQIVFRIQRF